VEPIPRNLSVLFPDGRTEFWFTTLVFDVGDTLHCRGKPWFVTSIGKFEPDGKRRHTTVTVRAWLDGDGEPSKDGNVERSS
jgi:hypothetical protein